MANTTNFGWETPDDTDLVKDGAAAMRTLGSAIDTSFVDLKGGTTGQVLSKATNTDLDYTWITPNVGDITEVQAGTGISVASGTGPIPVVTNSMATTIDAKGDLIVGTGADTFARLAVGATNGHTLQVDSSTATGLKWAALPSSGKILQVVQGTHTGSTSTTSASYVTTNLTASITPSATSSKVLIIVTLNVAGNNSGDGGKTTIYRGDVSTGTNLAGGDDFFQYFFVNTSLYYMSANMSYLDSPNTTSSTTYTVAFKRMAGTIDTLSGLQTIQLLEVGA